MGRRCKPTQLKLVENSRDRRSRAVINGEPVPTGLLTDAPDWLGEEEREIWNYAIAHAPLGLLKMIDSETLASWAIAARIRREAYQKLRASSLLIKGSKGNAISSPLLRIVNQQSMIMKALAAELGFSPAARTGIAIEEQQVEDPTDRFFPDTWR